MRLPSALIAQFVQYKFDYYAFTEFNYNYVFFQYERTPNGNGAVVIVFIPETIAEKIIIKIFRDNDNKKMKLCKLKLKVCEPGNLNILFV